MSTNTGGPAFPFSLHIGGNAGIVDAEECGAGGMTLRDYFAAKAMPSILNPNPVTGQYALVTDFEDCAITAYKMADAMLKAREA